MSVSGSNPYTLVFGYPPIEMIDRTPQLERIVGDFSMKNPANYISLVTGIRGSGKTVFITQVADKLKDKKNWIVVNLNSQRDLLMNFAAKLESDRTLSSWFNDAGINLQAFGLGLGIKGSHKITDIEEAISKMLKSIKKHNKRVLITIDEAVNSKEMREFTSAYQIFLRERLPVFLIMTGLFKDVDALRNSVGMTFLERAPRTVLSPLNINAIADNYSMNLGIKQDKANRLAKMSKGYSFGFQVMGYFLYENPTNTEKALDDAKAYLYEFAYDKIWSELSPKDREMAVSIANVRSGDVGDIKKIMNITTDQFNPYRSRLIKAGIINSPAKGQVEFALPFFDDYINEIMDSC